MKNAIAITSDGKTLATAGLQQIQLREMETATIPQRLNGSNYVQIMPDGKTLIGFQPTDIYKLNVGVWELSSGKLLYTIPRQLDATDEQSVRLWRLAFAP